MMIDDVSSNNNFAEDSQDTENISDDVLLEISEDSENENDATISAEDSEIETVTEVDSNVTLLGSDTSFIEGELFLILCALLAILCSLGWIGARYE